MMRVGEDKMSSISVFWKLTGGPCMASKKSH